MKQTEEIRIVVVFLFSQRRKDSSSSSGGTVRANHRGSTAGTFLREDSGRFDCRTLLPTTMRIDNRYIKRNSPMTDLIFPLGSL